MRILTMALLLNAISVCPATLAAQNLNHALAKVDASADGPTSNLLLHSNGGFQVRAFTSENDTRIWEAKITGRIGRLIAQNPEW